jgi:hypothetical protein
MFAKFKKEEPIAKVDVYLPPHHIKEKKSSTKWHEHQDTNYGTTWYQKGNQKSRGAWRDTALQYDIKIERPTHDTKGMIRIKLGWQGNSWTSCSSSVRMDGFMYLVLVGYIA